jgi:hypothetical protein
MYMVAIVISAIAMNAGSGDVGSFISPGSFVEFCHDRIYLIGGLIGRERSVDGIHDDAVQLAGCPEHCAG